MVATGQRGHCAGQQQDGQQGEQHGVDGHAIRPAQPTQQHAQKPPEREAGGGTEQHALGNVAAMRVEIGTEVRSAVLQAREVAVRRVADRFLGVEMGRQRRRIGLLAAQPQSESSASRAECTSTA
jgi:hypothetical protein